MEGIRNLALEAKKREPIKNHILTRVRRRLEDNEQEDFCVFYLTVIYFL